VARTDYPGPAQALARYERVIDMHAESVQRGAKNPYTSVNGHMYSFLDRNGSVGVRLSPDDRAEFLEQYDSRIAEQYGAQMKEYVVVPDPLLERSDELLGWLERSFDWVSSLKPKPTKR
jgi:hypothetical protein